MELSEKEPVEEEAPSITHYIGEERKLGEGWSAAVYAGELDGTAFCFKVFKGDDHWNLMVKEAELLEKLAEVPGVPRVLSYCESPLTLVTSYDGPKTLEEQTKEGPSLTVSQMLDVLLQVGQTLEGLHKCGVAHNDLKEDNVVLRFEGDRYVVTVIDFGTATAIGGRPYKLGFDRNITLSHLSPELSNGLPCSTKSEAYSLGTLMAWVAGRMPELVDDIELVHLIEAAMQEDPQERISVHGLVEGIERIIACFNSFDQESDSEDESSALPGVPLTRSPSSPPRRRNKRPRSSSDSCSVPLTKRPRLDLLSEDKETLG
ncbi:tyrosine-protein kinase yes-like [Oratosquilla oratoria]|uniref:tyrosine-protein kinase yes-like n=1 Tax=Oratosquilla oratoria TaxID=337810 RepID=UPI003F775B70